MFYPQRRALFCILWIYLPSIPCPKNIVNEQRSERYAL